MSWLLGVGAGRFEFRVSTCAAELLLTCAVQLRHAAMSATYCTVRVTGGCGRPSAVQNKGRYTMPWACKSGISLWQWVFFLLSPPPFYLFALLHPHGLLSFVPFIFFSSCPCPPSHRPASFFSSNFSRPPHHPPQLLSSFLSSPPRRSRHPCPCSVSG